MRSIKLTALLGLCILLLLGCRTHIPISQLEGAWHITDAEGATLVELKVHSDARFHVDVYALDGIEVEGHLEVEGDQVSFINDEGTDAVASDPRPGTYRYWIDDNILRFEKVSDPLDRRATFLKREWTRTEP